MKISKLRINHLKQPMGYQMDRVTFSWKVKEAQGKKQKWAHVRVSESADMKKNVYDSGERADADSIAFTANIALKPRTRYYWNVRVMTDAGEEAFSETQWFETGKMEESWSGVWITPKWEEQEHPIFFYRWKNEKEVRQGRLYICGLGLYEAYLNGEKVSDECLTPYCNDYTQWLQYQTFDVTEAMQNGENKLEVLVGNGWYKGRFGLDDDGTTRELYGNRFLLCAELAVTFTDGSTQIIATGKDWRVKKSTILDSSFYDGEERDDTIDTSQSYPVQIYKEKMPPLRERLSLPVRVQEILTPVRLLHTPKDELVLDLGQNHSGWFELRMREKKGAKIRLLFGEELQDGCFYNGNLRTGKSEYLYISDGVEKILRPHFTTFGYRYVKLEGVDSFREGDYRSLVLYSDLEQTGRIKTKAPLINQLISNALWGQKSNFVDIPMDCPQRDERMGWTGDAQVFSQTACYQMDCYVFYQKYLYDMYQEQKHRGGAVPFTIPACGQEQSCGIWGDAATILPFVVYEMYGDKVILEQQYESMRIWVEYIRTVNGDSWNWLKIFHFGDWLALDSRNQAMPTGGTDVGYVAAAYYYNSVCLLVRTAQILEKKEDICIYQKLAQEILEWIRAEYFTTHGRLSVDTQTGYLLALKFHLAPDMERMRKDLRNAFHRNQDRLETGFVGTSMLCEVLSENGMQDLAYTLLLNEDNPGWLFSVLHGATTIWERWDSLDENGHFSQSGLNSLNHYSYGAVVGWMYRHAAGMRTMQKFPGWREVILAPEPDYRLGGLEAEIDSPLGVYRCKWEVTESFGLRLEFEIPFGGKAYAKLPYAPQNVFLDIENPMFSCLKRAGGETVCVLKSGTYTVEYETTVPMCKRYGVHSSIRELMSNDRTKKILFGVLPMITMLPESMWDGTLKDMLLRADQKMTEHHLEEIDRLFLHEKIA